MLQIRRLGPGDWQTWRAFRLKMLADAPHAFASTHAETEARTQADWEDFLRNVHVFAASAEHLVGAAAWRPHGTGPSAHRADLFSVYVVPEWRGRRVFDRLLAAIIADLPPEIVQLELKVVAGNDAATAAYVRNGFEEVAILPRASKVGDAYRDQIMMLRKLDA